MFVEKYWTVDIIHVKINVIKDLVNLVKRLLNCKKLVPVDHIPSRCSLVMKTSDKNVQIQFQLVGCHVKKFFLVVTNVQRVVIKETVQTAK